MPEGLLEPGAPPLVALVEDAGSVEGRRLLDGGLVLEIEYGGAVVQVLLSGIGRFPEYGGILIKHPFGLRVPLSVQRLLDFWNVACRQAPRHGRARGQGRRDRGVGLRQLDALPGAALDSESASAGREWLARSLPRSLSGD